MTPEQYIAAVEEPKRSELATLHALIRKTLPKLEPAVSGTMLGYGPYHYRYESGREGDSFRVAISANRSGISVYVTAVDDGGWVVEQAKARLGRASVGKSCIRFKRLADIDLGALTDVLEQARQACTPGEAEPVKKKAAAKKKAAPKKKAARKR